MDNFTADGIFVDASPERVFRSFLDADDVREWMDADRVDVEARRGGRFSVTRADGSTVTGLVSVLQEGEFVGITDYSWENGVVRRGPMRLSLHITQRHGGCWITMRQDELDCPASGAAGDWKVFAKETHDELVRSTVALKRHVEGI